MAGRIVQTAGFSGVCYVSAVMAASVMVLAFYRPPQLFRAEDAIAQTSRRERESFVRALARLLSNRAALTAALVSLLWEFDPGWRTPLFYHYTNTLGFSASQYEFTDSIGAAGSLVSSLLYGVFCFKLENRRLMVISISVAVVGCAALAGVRSFPMAVAVACLVGLSTGLGDAGTADLLYRASPARLEGTSVLLGTASGILAADLADVVGTRLYERGGLPLALAITLATNVLILPLLYSIPSRVFATLEGVPMIAANAGRSADRHEA
jgi:MFS family permease